MTADEREVWRLCRRHPAYLVSSHGRVRRIGRRILKPRPNPRGYLYVDLGRKMAGQSVHGLVAEAFLGPRPAGAVPDHVDFDRTNNRASNLRWLHHTINSVRWAGRTSDGRIIWATPDTPPDEDHVPLTDEERADLDRHLVEAGWTDAQAMDALEAAGMVAQ